MSSLAESPKAKRWQRLFRGATQREWKSFSAPLVFTSHTVLQPDKVRQSDLGDKLITTSRPQEGSSFRKGANEGVKRLSVYLMSPAAQAVCSPASVPKVQRLLSQPAFSKNSSGGSLCSACCESKWRSAPGVVRQTRWNRGKEPRENDDWAHPSPLHQEQTHFYLVYIGALL
ncbi:hypothetical protein GH733_015220 [Mirounga leonina]|nr:hypothetical protein GH733_015220 [Mirounga leonina]